MAAFREGLKETGYIEGQNVAIEYRWAEGQYDRLPALAADLVRRQVAVIVAAAALPALAAKAATTTIPIVFAHRRRPGQGSASSPASTGRVATSPACINFDSRSWKRSGWSCCMSWCPRPRVIAVLVNPNYPARRSQLRDVQEAAARLGLQLVVLHASTESDFDAAFATLIQQRAGALLVAAITIL